MKTKSPMKKKIMLYVSLFVLTGFATLQGVAAAVEMPAFDRLTPLTDQVRAPADVAVDQQGHIYVAETTKNRVAVLSQSGRYTGKMLTDVSSPISVAVDSAGRIFVGNNGNGSVAVFSSNLSFQFKLGNGNGEFGKPSDIAIDAAGKIYVADKSNNAINTYNSSGAKTGSIGTPGNGNGQLHHPTSIAIDETGGEVVVLDHQQILDSHTGNMIDGARVQFFNKADGSFLRGFSKFGYNNAGMTWDPVRGMYTRYDITMGQLTKPNQVTVDPTGRVYVTDARLQKVMVYAVGPDPVNPNVENLNYLGTIDSAASPLRIPIGITFSASNRLYVTNLRPSQVGQVEVFGVENYSAMIAAPTAVEFSTIENAPAPPAKATSITNLGNTSFDWTASTSDSWVSLGTTTGTLASPGSDSIDIAVTPNGLEPGTHTGKVVVNTSAGTEEIKIVFTIEPNPIQVSPGTIDFGEVVIGSTPANIPIALTSGTQGVEESWEASVNGEGSWMSLSSSTGTTPSTVKVYADISSLSAGPYSGQITFNKAGDPSAPVTVNASMTLIEPDEPPVDPTVPGEGSNGMWNKKWSISTAHPKYGDINLNGVGGTSKANVYAVGDSGTILHYDGAEWTPQESLVEGSLNSTLSAAETITLAAGDSGTVLKDTGEGWTQYNVSTGALVDMWRNSETKPVQGSREAPGHSLYTIGEFGTVWDDDTFNHPTELNVGLRTIWGSSDTDIFVAGEAGAIYHYDGDQWTPMKSSTDEWINGLWGSSATDVYAVGENGTIVHFNGESWTPMDAGTTHGLNGICGTSRGDIYVVGNNSLVLRYNGEEWNAINFGSEIDLNDVWCSEKGDVFAVGDNGTVLQGKANKFPWGQILNQIFLNANNAREKAKEEDK